MKVGLRKPNIKKSIKARTTGKVKRKLKKSVNPLYGKKGIGFIKNPSKSIKNNVYHKATYGINDVIKSSPEIMNNSTESINKINSTSKNTPVNSNKNTLIILCCLGFVGLGGIHDFYLGNIGKGFLKLFTYNFLFIGSILDLIKICNDEY